MNQLRDLFKLMRPHQWLKNGFVFAGIFFSEKLDDPHILMQVIVTAIAFSLVSSSIYIFNDVIDREHDKHHPKKQHRPLPAGKVTVPVATILAIALGGIGLLLSAWISWKVLLIILLYVFLNTAYTLKLKNIVLIDVFCISAGFMLRILAGTIGIDIPPSKWLLLCGMMITLFLGFAKRRAEIIALQGNKESHRKVLTNYGPILLDEIMTICATGVIISYSLYTMSPDTIRIHQTENLIYTVPFVIYALFRYIFLLHHTQGGGDPSRDLIKDPHIMISVMGWAILTAYLT